MTDSSHLSVALRYYLVLTDVAYCISSNVIVSFARPQPVCSFQLIRYSSCRYNERQLIDVTVVRRVRPRAERWCDCEGHRRWCPLYVCSFFFATHHPPVITTTASKRGGRRAVGYRKVSWMLWANSCRCSVGGKTITLYRRSSRVRYSAPPFFSCFCIPFSFFLFFFSMGGGVLCMNVPFFFCNTPPTCNHYHCIDTPPLHRIGGGRRAVRYRNGSMKAFGKFMPL